MKFELIAGDCLQSLRNMDDQSVDLVFTSPPYPLKTMRYDGEARRKMKWTEWVDWMAEVIGECARVSRGFVMVNANNPVVKGECIPAVEHLVVKCCAAGLKIERPIVWHKNSPPNKREWWVNCWEPVYAFYSAGRRPRTWNWEAVASPPKYTKGGAFRQRNAKGERKLGGSYPTAKLARPRDVWYITVGGGHLGSADAHLNEAPFPEKLVEPAIRALTNPGDTVLDPFVGSGTTVAVAVSLGRIGIGIDVRESQLRMARMRVRKSFAASAAQSGLLCGGKKTKTRKAKTNANENGGSKTDKPTRSTELPEQSPTEEVRA